MAFTLHKLVREGKLAAIRAALERSPKDVNASNLGGHTPLMVAVRTDSSIEVVELLIEMGARLDDVSRAPYESGNVLSLAIRAGDLRKVAFLIEKGADVHYTYSAGYDAILDAAFGAKSDSPQLLDLLKLLIDRGAAVNTKSTYDEAALSILSCGGHFDAVRVLLDAGADPARLEWSPLHRAVALGSLDEVRKLIHGRAGLEVRDRRERTPFLLAVCGGDVAKAELLIQSGANTRARGHCGTTALLYAIECHRAAMFEWLLRIGADIEQTNEFGATPLMTAAEYDNPAAVRALLARDANKEAERNSQTALGRATSRDIIAQLLDAGADPRQLAHGGQRILIGLGEVSEDPLLEISKRDFLADCSPRFGTKNPEKMVVPSWETMIRTGANAYQAAQLCCPGNQAHPIWCAQRFGQSLTRLPDGRIIQIGGEHEDSYDPDFYIYNDVFVHRPDGTIDIFGYPEEDFPPTDFHSATLIGKYIYVVGSLGYSEARQFGQTQVFRLDTDTLRFERLNPTGTAPGWISRHRATHVSPNEIRITDGQISTHDGRKEDLVSNDQTFILDTFNLVWRRESGPVA